MRYSLRHVTTYHYEVPVTFAQCTLMLTPSSDAVQQVGEAVLSHRAETEGRDPTS